MFAISRLKFGVFLGCSAYFLAAPAVATDVTANLSMSATVPDSCTVGTATLSKLTYEPLTNTDESTSTNISVTCTNGTSYSILLNGGSEADTSARMLSDSTANDKIAYGLYQDAAHTTAWGNTTGQSADVVTSTGTGTAQTHTVYMLVDASATDNGSTVKVGTAYSDTVTITVSY